MTSCVAALTMYIRYRRLCDLHGDATTAISIVEQQTEALSIAMNALGLVERKNAYLTVPTYDSSFPVRPGPFLRWFLLTFVAPQASEIGKLSSWGSINNWATKR